MLRGWVPFVAACTVSACGHIGFDALPDGDGGPGDGGQDGGRDGGPDGGDPLGPFGDPRPLDELSSLGDLDDDPSLTDDLLEIYFKSDRGRGDDYDIWVASRDDPAEPFGTPVQVDELSSDGFDATPEVAADGLTIFLSSGRDGSAGADLFVSTRGARGQPWSIPVRVTELSSPADDFAATPNAALTRVVLTRAVDARSFDLFEATRASASDPWQAPAPLALSTEAYDADAHLSPNGLVVVFASERAGGAGRRDLWIATRESLEADLSSPTNLSELATPSDDEDPWLAGDGRTLVFASDRSGDRELWIATR